MGILKTVSVAAAILMADIAIAKDSCKQIVEYERRYKDDDYRLKIVNPYLGGQTFKSQMTVKEISLETQYDSKTRKSYQWYRVKFECSDGGVGYYSHDNSWRYIMSGKIKTTPKHSYQAFFGGRKNVKESPFRYLEKTILRRGLGAKYLVTFFSYNRHFMSYSTVIKNVEIN